MFLIISIVIGIIIFVIANIILFTTKTLDKKGKIDTFKNFAPNVLIKVFYLILGVI